MVIVPRKMVGLDIMSDYRGVRVQRFHCTYLHVYICMYVQDTY